MSVAQPTKKRRVASRSVAGQQHLVARVPRGYTGNPKFPVLMLDKENERCPHCFCQPCVISEPPDFLRGSAEAHMENQTKRFKLYTKLWQLLNDVGLRYHPEYLIRKASRTERDDPKEIVPECVITVIT